MIDFYTWKTPNGQKVAIMLEEIGLPYKLHPVDISKDQQFDPDYLKINPNNKIPTIVDQDGPNHEPISVFESGAILLYLAEKSGNLLSSHARQRIEAIQWLFFQMAGVGPMLGQAHHFLNVAPENIPYAINRYSNEAKRLYRVMNDHLLNMQYFAHEYSIADIAIYPWIAKHPMHQINIGEYPHLQRWFENVGKRKAVQKGMQLL